MPATNNLEARTAEWISGLNARTLPSPVIDKLKLATLDTFAAMLSGVTEPITQKVIALVVEPSDGEASIVGTRARARRAGAALANGTMAHACDYDDSSWTMWGHPTAPVLAAVLAVAEELDCCGIDFLSGIAVGLEVEKALGLGCQPEHYNRGYHPTGSLGVFGAGRARRRCSGFLPNKSA